MTLKTTAVKQKTCKTCRAIFTPARPMQKVCDWGCAMIMAVSDSAKVEKRKLAKDRRETKVKLDAMRKKPELVKSAQTAFNKFIRARDAGKPCITSPDIVMWAAGSNLCERERMAGVDEFFEVKK